MSTHMSKEYWIESRAKASAAAKEKLSIPIEIDGKLYPGTREASRITGHGWHYIQKLKHAGRARLREDLQHEIRSEPTIEEHIEDYVFRLLREVAHWGRKLDVKEITTIVMLTRNNRGGCEPFTRKRVQKALKELESLGGVECVDGELWRYSENLPAPIELEAVA